MKGVFSRNLALVVALLFSNCIHAQLYEMGIHFGYNISKLKPISSQVSETLSVFDGRSQGGATFGLNFLYGPPRDQAVKGFNLIPALMFEASLCRCGGRLNFSTSLADSLRSLTELNYLFYRADFSPKFVAQIQKFRFLAGPTVTRFFYSEVRPTGSDISKNAASQFQPMVFGYEFGVGWQIKSVTLSTRYQNHITEFGRPSPILESSFRNHQFKFMVHYYFLQKNRGSYWNSIYWN